MKTILSIIIIACVASVSIAYGEDTAIDKSQFPKGTPQATTFILTDTWTAQQMSEGYSGWRIEGSATQVKVKLHPESRDLTSNNENKDKKKKYWVKGAILENWYGTLQVWIYDIKEVI
jgi:hypothetical protein